jgi:hypothetical protein
MVPYWTWRFDPAQLPDQKLFARVNLSEHPGRVAKPRFCAANAGHAEVNPGGEAIHEAIL